jgi:hypothetical protein
MAGCGFDDSLTRRGFISGGDGICADTIVRASVEFQASGDQPAPGGTEALLTTTSRAYAAAANGFGGLKPREDDEEMRDRVVARFDQTAREMAAAAESTASGNAGATADARAAFVDLEAFAGELRRYGFELCGGR